MARLLLLFLMCVGCIVANDNVYHTKVADSEVYFISLKENPVNKDILIPNNDQEREMIAKTDNIPPNQHNVVLIKNPQFTALIDTGFANTQQTLRDSLKRLNVDFSSITHLIITHGHGDHIGGILNADGVNNFSNAELLIDKREFDYWQEKGGVAKDSLNAFKKRRFFEKGKNLFQNQLEIKPIEAYGHTPGHNLIQIGSKLVFWADLLHVFAIQSKNPLISVKYDVNPAEAAKTREYFLQKFKQDKTEVIGSHVPFIKPIVLD